MKSNVGMGVIINQPNSIGPQEMMNGRYNGHDFRGAIPAINTSSFGAHDFNNLTELANSERVLIQQKRELLEVILGCETENKYDILDDQNQVILHANESSQFCMRCMCGPLRPIVVDIRDVHGNPVIFLDRPLACQDPCCYCCLQEMEIQSPPGTGVGKLEQKFAMRPLIQVKDEGQNVVFVVKGPPCQFSCRCGDVEFPIYASDGKSELGMISKRWGGIFRETFTDADIFGVKFPPNISTQMKILLIASAFLIDYMYFEGSNK